MLNFVLKPISECRNTLGAYNFKSRKAELYSFSYLFIEGPLAKINIIGSAMKNLECSYGDIPNGCMNQ